MSSKGYRVWVEGRWRRLVPRGEGHFLRHVFLLSGGSAVGQLLLFAAYPLLTRLYSPEAFGTFGVFVALFTLLGANAVWSLEIRVPMVTAEGLARGLVVAGWANGTLTALLALFLVALFGEDLARGLGMPALAPLLWLLPPALLLWGWGLVLQSWHLRRQRFLASGLNQALRLTTQGAGQLVFGQLTPSPLGLVGGFVLGCMASPLHFWGSLPQAEKRALLGEGGRELLRAWRIHLRHMLFVTSANLVRVAVQIAPTLLFAGFFGAAVAGWFTLALRMLEGVVELLGGAGNAVYMAGIGRLSPADRRVFFLRVVARYAAIGGVVFAPVAVFGPELFAWTFGADWRTSGEIARFLALASFLRLLLVPVQHTLAAFERPRLYPALAAFEALGLAATFLLLAASGASPLTAALLYASFMGSARLLGLGLLYRVARAGGAKAPATG